MTPPSPPTVPLVGATLVTGPSNVGKTRLTARALDDWVDEHGPDGVVVLDFAPEVERDGVVLGGRLTRFTTVPAGVWYAVLDARAPRAESTTPTEARRLAAANARRAATLLGDAPPDPTAVFVNDATIPFQDGRLGTEALTDRCGRATLAVLNAFESDELGVDDSISRNERATLDALAAAADRRIRLPVE